MLAATAAMPSSASPRPAPSSASTSGTTSAQGSQFRLSQPSHICPNSSPLALVRPDRHRFCSSYGALSEAVVFLDYFKDLPDPRQRGKVIYPLDEVLLLCLLAVLGGAETFVDIARFGEKKI